MKMKNLKRKSVSVAIALILVITTLPVSTYAQEEDLREIRTYAGSREASYENGVLSATRFTSPSSFITLGDSSVVVADSGNHTIRQLNNSQSTSFAGSPLFDDQNYSSYGALIDGKSEAASFNQPGGLAVDSLGNIIVADTQNHAVRKITSDGLVTTIAGQGGIGNNDGLGQTASFYEPHDVAVDSKGNIYVADTLNHTIRVIDTAGKVKTLTKPSSRVIQYGDGIAVDTGDYVDGKIADSKFNEPVALLIDKKDNLYVSDRGNQRIRYIDFEYNTVSTIAGTGQLMANELYVEGNHQDGSAEQSSFNSPSGLVWLDEQTLLIADSQNHVIRQLKNGEVTTLVGQVEQFGFDNGLLSHATLNEPIDVLVQADGSILILEKMSNQIRKLATYDKFIEASFGSNVEVYVNGTKLATDVQTVNGRTLIPLRTLSEQLGLEINYEPVSTEITLTNKDTSFKLLPHSDIVEVTKAGKIEIFNLDVPVVLNNDRSFIPVRFISEQLGLNVAWDNEHRNVVIRQHLYTMEVK